MQFSVIPRLRHSIEKTRLLEYYRTYNKPVIGYGLLLYGCNSEIRLNPLFVLQKEVQRQTCLKLVIIRLRTVPWTICIKCLWLLYCWAPQTFLISVRSVLPTEKLNSLYERKVSNVQTRKTQFNLPSLSGQSCFVSCKSLRYRGGKLFKCLIETGSGIVVFSRRFKRKTLKHIKETLDKPQTSKIVFQWDCSSCAVTVFGSAFNTLQGRLWWCFLCYRSKSFYCYLYVCINL